MTSLDNQTQTPIQYGENGHIEYTWSSILEEKIHQFYVQTTRTSLERVKELGVILHDIIVDIREQYNTRKITKENYIDMLSILYKMIGLTRDVTNGKGEYTLSYMMVYTWYSFYPDLAFFALKTFVLSDETETETETEKEKEKETFTHPYGSWKDMKYFCNYCLLNGCDLTHPLICFCLDLVNNQLKKDISLFSSPNHTISLVAKWIPNEKSNKFGWFYKLLAVHYFPNYMASAVTSLQEYSATKKCYTEYRKICSRLNKRLDTVQIKQCSNKWSTIDPSNQTSITMHKQKNAFLNRTKKGGVRTEKTDRIECAVHFKDYVTKALNGEVIIKGKRIGMNDFTRDAIVLLNNDETDKDNSDERNILNLQWADSSKTNGALGNMIAMVDVSGSMVGEPLHAAIALGIRIAEKSALGKRILTFSASPNWVNLETSSTFVDMVDQVKDAHWGCNTNIYSAFKMIRDAIETSELPKEDVSNMLLVILSDMQIDTADDGSMILYNEIENMYKELGKKMYNTPIRPPHILFWNLRSTNGFPTLSSQPNISCVSGFNASFLNLFCEKGIESLTACRPWTVMIQSLDNERYKMLDDRVREYLTI